MRVILAQKNQLVQIQLPDGRAFDGEPGTDLEAFIKAAYPDDYRLYMGALVDGKLRELSTKITRNAEVTPITSAESDGSRIYRRSLTFMMIAATAELFHGVAIKVKHSMPFGGYYCEREDGEQFSRADLDAIEQRMRQLVEADAPIRIKSIDLEAALDHFRALGDSEKVALFSKRRNEYLKMYHLNGVRDYFHGFMVPSAGYIKLFGFKPYRGGFILRFPRRTSIDRLQPFEDAERLVLVFQTYDDWLDIIGVPGVAALNKQIASGKVRDTILVAEALHNRQLAKITSEIENRVPRTRLILVSGPTSAGKTTFSKRLAVQLLARGIHPVALEMDNYFVNRVDTPLDEHGDYDFERIEAIDLPLFQKHLKALLAGEVIVPPHFDFKTGVQGAGDHEVRLGRDQILIIEGIHGLNPRLIEGVATDQVYRVFISALTQLNLDRHNRIATTDTRKLRRIVRDFKHRGYSAADTIRRWPSVRKGEKRYIFPNQIHADRFFNSALVYELAALKRLAEPILLQVEPGTPERVEANRLRAFLQWFDPIDESALACVPPDSILREFIGGSVMSDYEPWVR